MDATALYDEDFYAWSEQQASALRRLGQGATPLPNDLDLQHVAEEVEDLGKAELRRVCSLLRQFFIHAIKLHAMPGHESAQHWKEEATAFLDQAGDHYSRAMAQHIELDEVWARAANRAATLMTGMGADQAAQDAVANLKLAGCPFRIEDLLDGEPTVDDLLPALGRTP